MSGIRIGLTAGARTVDRLVEQAQRAEADGFTSLWYAGAVAGDPLAAMAVVGRATSRIELGTSVLQTYPVHPVLQATRAVATANAMGRGGFTLGVGPSHQPVVEAAYGLSYDKPGEHTEEYLRVLAPLLRGEKVDHDGAQFRVHVPGGVAPEQPVPLLVAALGPRLLRVSGELADGVILWMTNATAIERHVAPRLAKAAADAGRTADRIVAGLPVAVHDDVAEAREVIARQFAGYGTLPNYRRILDLGEAAGPADAAIVGDEQSVTAQLAALADAGATDFWAAPVAVGGDPAGSRARTRALLADLARAAG